MTKHKTGARHEFIMRKVQTMTVMVGLLLSLTVSAQKATVKGRTQSSRCREIWKFNWRSARSHRTSETMPPSMS